MHQFWQLKMQAGFEEVRADLASCNPAFSPQVSTSAAPAQVRDFLQHGASPDSKNAHGMTCLHWASQNEDLLVMDVLLSNGASPDVCAQDGCSPLHLACREENVHAVALLLRCAAFTRPRPA